jgi:AAA15 family ATPase/GTPase
LHFKIESALYIEVGSDGEIVPVESECNATMDFNCNKKTQEIVLNSIEYRYGTASWIKISKSKASGQYTLTTSELSDGYGVVRKKAFLFGNSMEVPSMNQDEWMKYFKVMHSLEKFQDSLEKELTNILYLGPFRISPKRQYHTKTSSPNEVGPLGESAITMLANEYDQSKRKDANDKITKWLKQMNLAKKVGIKRLLKSDLFDVSIGLNDDVDLPLADLGYGLSQVLPVLVQCAFAPEGSTLLFEQPELHLHMLAARKLNKVFCDTIHEKKCKIIIETHSAEMITQLLSNIRDNDISIEDVVIYKVVRESGATKIAQVTIENTVEILELWRTGVDQK